MAIQLKTQGQNLTMYQGASFEKTFTAKDENSFNVSIDTGTCSAQMKKNYTTTNASFILTFTTALTGSNVTISANSTLTGAMTEGLHVYEVEYTQSDNVTKEKLVNGMITVLPEVIKT
tara:strand:- start:7891 stop:8244 length:354 start_codon:yes stop_codon:yes gene_type:complete